MVLIEEAVVLVEISQIPAKIEIIAGDIGQIDQRVLMLEHESVRHGGGTGAVHAVAEVERGDLSKYLS